MVVMENEFRGKDVDVVSFKVLLKNQIAYGGIAEIGLEFLNHARLFLSVLEVLFDCVLELSGVFFKVLAVKVKLLDFGYFLIELRYLVHTVVYVLSINLLLPHSLQF